MNGVSVARLAAGSDYLLALAAPAPELRPGFLERGRLAKALPVA